MLEPHNPNGLTRQCSWLAERQDRSGGMRIAGHPFSDRRPEVELVKASASIGNAAVAVVESASVDPKAPISLCEDVCPCHPLAGRMEAACLAWASGWSMRHRRCGTADAADYPISVETSRQSLQPPQTSASCGSPGVESSVCTGQSRSENIKPYHFAQNASDNVTGSTDTAENVVSTRPASSACI